MRKPWSKDMKSFALGPQAVNAETGPGGWSFEPCPTSFDWTLTLLPRHTQGVLWNLPSLELCFSIWSNFWEKETEPVACAPSPRL